MKLFIVVLLAAASLILHLPSLEALGCMKQKTCTTLKELLKGELPGKFDDTCGDKCDMRSCFKDGVYYMEAGCKDTVKWVCKEGENVTNTDIKLDDKDCDPNGPLIELNEPNGPPVELNKPTTTTSATFDSKFDALKIAGMVLIGLFVGQIW